jgi:HEAT repeat protein
MMHPFTYRNFARYGLASLIVLSATTAFVVRARLAGTPDQDIQKLNRLVQTSKSNTAAMQMFREGRDLIEAENWLKASEKFRDFIVGYPKDKDIDAALYWYGYALQKQGKRDEAVVPLLKLINNFPGSSWRREAEALLVVLGRGDVIQQALNKDNCEIKILALQSLFQANEDRAITFVTEVMKSTSTECPGLKGAAVSLLGSHGGARAIPFLLDIARNQTDLKLRLTAIKRLGEQKNDSVVEDLAKLYDSDRTKEVRAQILRALAESRSARGIAKLIEVARGTDDVALRQLAIRYLGELKASDSFDELIRIFDADHTPEIRSQILRALAQSDDPRAHAKVLEIARKGETPELRIEAIRRLADRGQMSVDDLLQLYGTETNTSIKMGLLRAFADMKDPRGSAKLWEIARGGDAPDLRLYAIRQVGNKNDEQTIDQLIAMYDAEQNMQVKGTLLRAFGNSQQKNALRKLMTIARNDQSVELRKLAVRMLGESKDPEALKFLEDLLK